MKKIIIIGTGWYGCHLYTLLYKKYNVMIIEKNGDIFNNSSYYNQNRLHLGYHYCRNYPTRSMCKHNYDLFLNKYNELVDDVNNNYYLIANCSFVDFQTYINIYSYENYNFELINNDMFDNIQDKIIVTKEKCINAEKVYNYFKEIIHPNDLFLNTKVMNYEKLNDLIVVNCTKNNEQLSYACDLLFDCTYNQLGWSKKEYIYELTCSILLKRNNNEKFGAITLMDGKLFSLYPRDIKSNLYTLTDVEYTPIISSFNYEIIENYKISDDDIIMIKNKMFAKVIKYYKSFEDDFEYVGYFLAKKTKLISGSDSREITIERSDNVITTNCGKIYGIFELEKYVTNELKL